MTPAEVDTEIAGLERLFTVRDDIPAVLPEWRRIVAGYQVVGKNAHDARLVAAMRVHGIDRILTFNPQDFQRFQNIVVISPQQVLATP